VVKSFAFKGRCPGGNLHVSSLMMFHKNYEHCGGFHFHSTILFFIYMQPSCHRVVDGADSTSVGFKPNTQAFIESYNEALKR
jgi:hypothetical protein